MKVSLELTKSPSFNTAYGSRHAIQANSNVYTHNPIMNLNMMPNSTKTSLITFKGNVNNKEIIEQKDREIAKAILLEGAGFVITVMSEFDNYSDMTLIQATDDFTQFGSERNGRYKKLCELLGNYDLWTYDKSDDALIQPQVTKDRFKNIINLLEEESKKLTDISTLDLKDLNPKDKRVKKAFDVYKEKGYKTLRIALVRNFAKESGFYAAVGKASKDLNPELMEEKPQSVYNSIRKKTAYPVDAINSNNQQTVIEDLRYLADIMFDYGSFMRNDEQISIREFAGYGKPKVFQTPEPGPQKECKCSWEPDYLYDPYDPLKRPITYL